ncbi:universal stress protein [Streptomyces sp. NPDC051976]|uniref:universal stress protein n=1 Tax=Streptomyces sp. NPDC051976 TaxID=3154947 RepID=UPI003439CC42
MELPVVVGVDGSDAAVGAVDWAADEAARTGQPLRLVFASLWEHYDRIKPNFSPDRASEEILAERIVASAREQAEALRPDVKVTAEVVPHDPVTALLTEAEQAYAVVVGNRGRGEITDLLLGSTSLTVAARAQCPVVVVRGPRREPGDGRPRVVLGVGAEDRSSAAGAFAFRQAARRGAVLEVVRAWRRPRIGSDDAGQESRHAQETLDDIVASFALGHAEVPVELTSVEGHPRKALLERAAGADLLVVGARHRHSKVGLQLGPVNHGVLHHSPCPVAVVPQPA